VKAKKSRPRPPSTASRKFTPVAKNQQPESPALVGFPGR
jgi:hypothetical protein